MIADHQIARAWTIPDEILAGLIEVSRHEDPQPSPQEYECGCVTVERITDRDAYDRRRSLPWEMRLARPCARLERAPGCELYALRMKHERPWCYWVFPNWWHIEDSNRFTVSIVFAGIAGHFPTGTRGTAKIITRTDEYAAACDEAYQLNRDRHVSDRETAVIVASMLGATDGPGERLL